MAPSAALAAPKARPALTVKLKVSGTLAGVTANVATKGRLPRGAKARLQYKGPTKRWVTASTRRLVRGATQLSWSAAAPGTRYRVRVQILRGRRVVSTTTSLIIRVPRKRPTSVAAPPIPAPAPYVPPAPATGAGSPIPPDGGGLVATPTPSPAPELAAQPDAQVAVGNAHSCAITATQTVRCWGTNSSGQLGVPGTAPRAVATPVPGIEGAVALAAGARSTCALTRTAEVFCWGGDAGPTEPARIATAASRIAAAGAMACATAVGEHARCWSLAEVSTASVGIIAGTLGATDIGMNESRTCARMATGFRCWPTPDPPAPDGADPPAEAARGFTATDARTFVATTTEPCAPLEAGPTLCDTSRQLAAKPAWATAFDQALAIAGPGGGQRCLITPQRTVACIIDGTAPAAPPTEPYRPGGPSALPGLADVTAIAVGPQHACAMTAAREVLCWGSGGDRLGLGVLTRQPRAVSVAGVANATSVEVHAGGGCASTQAGQMVCWGAGSRPAPEGVALPAPVAGVGPVAEVFTSADGLNPCARTATGEVVCLTGGTPSALPGWSAVEDFAPGASHACAVLTGGSVACSGDNASGQLGGPTPAQSTSPITVPGITSASAIASSATASCALLADGTVTCWGRLQGASADVDPTPVPGLTGATDLVGSPTGFCAARAAAESLCWGSVRPRETPGNASDQEAPLVITGVRGLPAAGASHWCGLLAAADVLCWGTDGNGELGRGVVSPPAQPQTPVVDLPGALSVAVSADHSCAITPARTVACWGASGVGQLGTGATASRPAPTPVVPSG